ncbi:MAG: trimethylamine methyltransferase family protein, partial [Deltaproteobacteria bacterium]|nr:trimethylamine methyltransferase family protein [Deltaproteobacteria bacterium]
IGPGGSFLAEMHTMQHMRDTAVLPKVASRSMRSKWESRGRLTAQDYAMAEARKILSKPNPVVFDKELDAKIRSRFKGLVAGDAKPI